MAPGYSTQYVLQERPETHITPTTFARLDVPIEKPGEKQILVQVQYLSIDPAMRGWLRDTRSYVPPVKIGEVMRAAGLGTVVETGPGSQFSVGDVVYGLFGWREYAIVSDDDQSLKKIVVPPKAELLDFLGVLGSSGLTAYFGLFDVGKLKPTDTVVVSGAAGAVGSIVCQLAKMFGCPKVVAIAGSPEKCKWLKEELGVDEALNYKEEGFKQEFKDKVGYFDVYFDNVGGEILDLALTRMKEGARIALCGAISDYNKKTPAGLTNYLSLISMRATLQGFIVFDYRAQYPKAIAEMAKWIEEGKLKRRFTVVEGLDKAYDALNMLFTGGNTGKTVVKVTSNAEASRL